VTFACIAILSPGDMGHGVGAFLGARGYRVVTALDGRSSSTRARAERAGIEDLGNLGSLVACADLVLSILPPDAAESLARAVAEACRATPSNRRPLYADCNAVAPATAEGIRTVVEAGGMDFVDGGIVGSAPGRGSGATRLYVSGPRASEFEVLSDAEGGLVVRNLGLKVGSASGLKMTYAALTKGTMTLHAAVLMTAWRLGLFSELARELAESQPEAWRRMAVLPFLPADAERWIGEMEQIAATFRDAGLPEGFHESAAQVFRNMARTPFAAETRETLDKSRTLEEAIRAFVEQLDP
jgi:3-hydroxyisobutyrate dehydrogenase-like beta-hydroxyacid dehydrogenase